MTHEAGHIECGGAGKVLGTKSIIIKDHEFLNVALHLKHEELAAFFVSKGLSPDKAMRRALHLGREIQSDANRWYDKFESWGIDTHEYDPDPANL